MGKIFKALEKAEKRPAANKADPLKTDEPLDRKQSGPSVISRRDDDLSTLEPRPRSNQSPIQSETVDVPTDQTNRVSIVDSSLDSKNPIGAKTVEIRSSLKKERRIILEDATEKKITDSQAIGPVNTINKKIGSNAIYESHEDNVALVEPEIAEVPNHIPNLNPMPSKVIYGDKTESLRSTTRKGVNVRYSMTKVQINDPQKLKDNKVLSMFEDFETTNQFKILRTQVLRKMKALGGNSILVTSANPCEGKTFTSINLGISIAKEFDRTVLIIDADIRRPAHQHTDFSTEFFSLKVEKGLTDYLVGDANIEDVLINPGIDKLTLIPGGLPVDNSPELLNSPKMEEMMAEIKSRYPSDRLVIVDGPAILHFPDAMILSRYVDGVLPVIESEKTASEDVKKMMVHLNEVNILGVVLNKNKG